MSLYPFADSSRLGVQTRWVEAYTDFVATALGLCVMHRAGGCLGMCQALVTSKVRQLLELSDECNSLGCSPTLAFAGEEAVLWHAAARYGTTACWELLARPAALPQLLQAVRDSDAAWGEFLGVVAGLSDDFATTVPALDPSNLRPDRLDRLFQPCLQRPHPYVRDNAGQPVGQQFDQPILR